MPTQDELLAKLEARYKPLVDAARADEAKAKMQADQLDREWSTRRIGVQEYFAAQAAIAQKTAIVAEMQTAVDAAAALPAPVVAPVVKA